MTRKGAIVSLKSWIALINCRLIPVLNAIGQNILFIVDKIFDAGINADNIGQYLTDALGTA
jgi:hypothetical protein